MNDRSQKPTVPPKPPLDGCGRASGVTPGGALPRETVDTDLDSLLMELRALEDQLNSSKDPEKLFSTPSSAENELGRPKTSFLHPDSGSLRRPFSARNPPPSVVSAGEAPRTASPDNDSAFCDSGSFTSSESVLSGAARNNFRRRSALFADPTGTPDEWMVKSAATSEQAKVADTGRNFEAETADERRKAEKIKLALEQMREARVKKLYVKFSRVDGESKSLLVDERWAAGRVLRLLADEFRTPYCVNHALVESCPELHLERMYEDHELLVENILLWNRESNNAFFFVERADKFGLFYDPQVYLLRETGASNSGIGLDAAAKHRLIADFFSAPQLHLPETKGVLYIKSDGKKSWKKFYCTLRSSGFYFCPKGKAKTPKDLVCLCRTETVQIYKGVDWRRMYKAPTDFGFALKHPKIQAKASKYIKYFCVDDEETLNRWTASFRLVKNGKQLFENFAECCDYLPGGSEETTSGQKTTPSGEPSKAGLGASPPEDASSSFELDFSARGTIKRRPARLRRADSPSLYSDSASADVPLDSADEAESDSDERSVSASSAASPPFPAPPPVGDPRTRRRASTRRAPPAPPKRSENTRLSVASIPSSVISEEKPKPPVPAKPVVFPRELSAPAVNRKSPSAATDFRSELREALQRRMDKVEASRND